MKGRSLVNIIGPRLQEQRLKLGFTQAETAKKIGVSLSCYWTWEAGKCSPNAGDLVALKEAGFDWLFVLIGWSPQHAGHAVVDAPDKQYLNKREEALVRAYRNSDRLGKIAFLAMADAVGKAPQ
jgi:transcriptional regulator with XRE-family HTH domain